MSTVCVILFARRTWTGLLAAPLAFLSVLCLAQTAALLLGPAVDPHDRQFWMLSYVVGEILGVIALLVELAGRGRPIDSRIRLLLGVAAGFIACATAVTSSQWWLSLLTDAGAWATRVWTGNL